MTDPYLIAHKVDNEQRFEVAMRMDCPECKAEGCPECDDLGYWYITSSGHRPYAYWSAPLDLVLAELTPPEPPEGWRNSYDPKAGPAEAKLTLAELGFRFVQKPINIRRRV
jgi:hypothetical protein